MSENIVGRWLHESFTQMTQISTEITQKFLAQGAKFQTRGLEGFAGMSTTSADGRKIPLSACCKISATFARNALCEISQGATEPRKARNACGVRKPRNQPSSGRGFQVKS